MFIEATTRYLIILAIVLFIISTILTFKRRSRINNFACRIDPAMKMSEEEDGWLGSAMYFLDSNPGDEFTGRQIAEGIKIEEAGKAFLESDKFAYHLEAFSNFTVRKIADGPGQKIYYSYHKSKQKTCCN